MLEKVLCVKGFTRDGEGLAKLGEVERNGFVGCGEWVGWMPCNLSVESQKLDSDKERGGTTEGKPEVDVELLEALV